MNAREFMHTYGRDETRRVAEAAGTNLAYFEQLACGARRPSFDLAERLTIASSGRMDTLSLLRFQKEIEAVRNSA
jgi:hypothetical protein